MKLLAGASVKSITPPEGMSPLYLAGYKSFFADTVTGVNDQLSVRALAVGDGREVAFLVGLDLVGVFLDDVTEIRRLVSKKGLQGENLLIYATHTHAGPDVMGLWGPELGISGVNQDYMDFLYEQVIDAVVEAAGKMTEVDIKVAFSSYPRAIKNLRDPDDLNDTLALVVFKDCKRYETVASLVSYTAQPETTTRDNRLLSADFPGIVRSMMEKEIGGVCIYATGVDGAMSPLRPEAGFGEMQRLGDEIGSAALDLLDRLVPLDGTTFQFTRRQFTVPIEVPEYKIAAELGLIRRKPDGDNMITEINRLDLGRLSIVTIPGEPLPGITRGLKENANVFYISQANDFLGYFIPYEQFNPDFPRWTEGFFTGQEQETIGRESGRILREELSALLRP